MTYELAKQLKDAGFPQHQSMENGDYFTGQEELYASNPTLSELIEACGDGFRTLDRFRENDWVATGVSPVNGGTENNIAGKTPEESFAKLWLWLNLNKQ